MRYSHDITQSRDSLHWRHHSETDIEFSLSVDWAFSSSHFSVSFWRYWLSQASLSTQIFSHHTELKDQQTYLSEMSFHCCSQLWVWVFRCWWSIYVTSAFTQDMTESTTLWRMFKYKLWASHALITQEKLPCSEIDVREVTLISQQIISLREYNNIS